MREENNNKWKDCYNFLLDPKVFSLLEGVKNEMKELHLFICSPYIAYPITSCVIKHSLCPLISLLLLVWYCCVKDFHKVINNISGC